MREELVKLYQTYLFVKSFSLELMDTAAYQMVFDFVRSNRHIHILQNEPVNASCIYLLLCERVLLLSLVTLTEIGQSQNCLVNGLNHLITLLFYLLEVEELSFSGVSNRCNETAHSIFNLVIDFINLTDHSMLVKG